jgi:hypothetical protein
MSKPTPTHRPRYTSAQLREMGARPWRIRERESQEALEAGLPDPHAVAVIDAGPACSLCDFFTGLPAECQDPDFCASRWQASA